MSSKVCDMDCLHCKFSDCINDSDMTLEERSFSKQYETSLKKSLQPQVIPELGMQRYIHNRPDKEAYIKARNAEYEEKRKGSPERRESKKRQYQRHRGEKLAYQKSYYEEHKDEILARQKSAYEQNREEINAKRRAERRAKGIMPKTKMSDEERKEKQRQYRLEHREEINRRKRESYHRRKEQQKNEHSEN